MDPAAPPHPDAIHRVLFVAASVHVYHIPPMPSTKGHVAAAWTAPPSRHIFTARLRIVETATPAAGDGDDDGDADAADAAATRLTASVLLEDGGTGELFAAAPYGDDGAAVEAAADSSRFFALRVVGDGGRRAVLGIGFEERATAVDFGIALQEVRKLLGGGGGVAAAAPPTPALHGPALPKRDFRLRDGQTIHIDLGGRGKAEAWIEPPSGGAAGFALLPPPPPGPGPGLRAEKRRSRQGEEGAGQGIEDLGFDDGEFGEFR
jgi:hypothetical protein